MTIQGTIKKILPVESGVSNGNTWKNQLVIIEQGGEYPKQIAVKINPEKVDINQLTEGESITAHINIESREYNDRFYTDVKAWKIEKNQQ
jgi:hypothetical protein